MHMKTLFTTLLALSAFTTTVQAQEIAYNTPGAGNPFIPGYFADPTIKKFGDTYYLYATTDGSGAGFGPSQCWTSKDFRNWTLRPMNWPTSHWIWAPDVMQKDSKYYMVYCQPCNLYIGQADTPLGPWHNLLGDGIAQLSAANGPQGMALGKDYDNEGQPIWVYDRYVTGAITLDGQTFVDDDGSVYVYWGTWGIYDGFGCGVGKASEDMKTFTETRLIPNTEATDFFEAPFVLKRNGIYYFMYSSASCHDETYHVQYATSRHPMGPYKYQGTILKTNADGTVHGPGHHSVLEIDGEYYIVYHRHDNPHSTRGFHRQICIDKLEFDRKGRIKPVTPTHSGVNLGHNDENKNLAYCAQVTASSHYDKDFIPAYAVDDNNGTLWRPRTNDREWLQIDLGKVQHIETVWTQWEYGTQYYQYLIETSADGQQWQVFADRSQNRHAGSPKVDVGNTEARFVRITFLNAQKVGYPGALWNVKVFATREDQDNYEWPEPVDITDTDAPLISISADNYQAGDTLPYIQNYGLEGGFEMHDAPLLVEEIEGRKAFHFDSLTVFTSDFLMPAQWRDNTPYTLDAWVLNPQMEENECVADFTTSHDELEKIMLISGTEPRCGVINHYGWYEDVGYPARPEANDPGMKGLEGKWTHIYACFDGRMERVYVNDKLISERDIQIMVKPVQFVTLGRNAEHEWPFTGYLHSLKLWNRCIEK